MSCTIYDPAPQLSLQTDLPVSSLYLPNSHSTQVGSVLNCPFVLHVTVRLPEYPTSHATSTLVAVLPVILPAVALFELATLPFGMQSFAGAATVNSVPEQQVPND